MPSFDISSKANMDNIRNAVDVSMRMIMNRYDFKGTSARVELLEKEMQIVLSGDAEFQINQIKDILFPAMEKKEPDSSKRMEAEKIESVSGNKSNKTLKSKVALKWILQKRL
jgi:uncharacterized protein YajQ (UPF0234 family)